MSYDTAQILPHVLTFVTQPRVGSTGAISMENDKNYRERTAAAATWAVRLACNEAQFDVLSIGRDVVVALDDLDSNSEWTVAYRSDPAGFLAAHSTECAEFGDALEHAADPIQQSRAIEAYRRADAVPQQSGAEIVLAAGAAAALIIFALRVGVVVIDARGITIRAYKPDRTTADTVKAAGSLVSALFSAFSPKSSQPQSDQSNDA